MPYELPFLLPERWIGRDDHSLRMLIGNLVEGGLSRLSIDVQATSHGVHRERETAASWCYAQEPVNSVSRTAREAGAEMRLRKWVRDRKRSQSSCRSPQTQSCLQGRVGA